MYQDRKKLYAELAKERNSSLLVYITGDRQGLETQIAPDSIELFGNLLDHYQGSKKISLYLYTRGGETLSAWGLVNLLREFCAELEIIIPSKCLSSGTLICLGADTIVMTKQATLGPIDPSVNTPINPEIPGGQQKMRLPISVEDIAGFLDMARTDAKISGEDNLSLIFQKLTDNVHPIALGRVKRARTQIQSLARKLLIKHMKEDDDKIKRIIDMLCTEAGSHDYMIYRTEASCSLGLNVETPSDKLYQLIKNIYLDIKKELELEAPYNPEIESKKNQGNYNFTRAIIESQNNGAYHFKRKGQLKLIQIAQAGVMQNGVQDFIQFEGWEFIQ